MKAIIVNTSNKSTYPMNKPFVSGLNHQKTGKCIVPELGEDPHVFDSTEQANEYINSIGRADILKSIDLVNLNIDFKPHQ
jgi:hypothetical protein